MLFVSKGPRGLSSAEANSIVDRDCNVIDAYFCVKEHSTEKEQLFSIRVRKSKEARRTRKESVHQRRKKKSTKNG